MVSKLNEYGADLSILPYNDPLSLNWTLFMPFMSEAVALRVVIPETVDPVDGDVMFVVGFVLVSPNVQQFMLRKTIRRKQRPVAE